MKKLFLAVWDFVFYGGTSIDEDGYKIWYERGADGKLRRYRTRILSKEEQAAELQKLLKVFAQKDPSAQDRGVEVKAILRNK